MRAIRSRRRASFLTDGSVKAIQSHFAAVIADHTVATAVARRKSYFFIEKDANGQVIDYMPAAIGHLKIVPEGKARMALARDYAPCWRTK